MSFLGDFLKSTTDTLGAVTGTYAYAYLRNDTPYTIYVGYYSSTSHIHPNETHTIELTSGTYCKIKIMDDCIGEDDKITIYCNSLDQGTWKASKKLAANISKIESQKAGKMTKTWSEWSLLFTYSGKGSQTHERVIEESTEITTETSTKVSAEIAAKAVYGAAEVSAKSSIEKAWSKQEKRGHVYKDKRTLSVSSDGKCAAWWQELACFETSAGMRVKMPTENIRVTEQGMNEPMAQPSPNLFLYTA